MSESITDIQARLARLEAQVAWLVERAGGKAPEGEPSAHDKTDPGLALPVPPVVPPPIPWAQKPAMAGAPSGAPANPILLIAGIGAAIFLLGAIFFLHLAIQRGWIGPEMRFVLGLVVGCGLSFGAARMILGDSPKLGTCLLLAGLGTLMFTLRWGSINERLIPVGLGFAGSALAAVFAGGLAGRARFAPPLWVGLLAGLLTPLVFSQGGHHEIALTLYLAALMGAALLVPYASGIGARWSVGRWMAVAGTWSLLALSCAEVLEGDAGALLALLVVHYLLAGVWIWLPRQEEDRPSSPTLLWFLVSLAGTSLAWVLWKRLHLAPEWFAGPALLVAALNLGLVKPLRERLQGHSADLGLLVLAAGHLALAVPIALDWSWVGLLWGLFALGLAWAVEYAQEHPDWEEEEARSLLVLAVGMTILATLMWMIHAAQFFERSGVTPFLNRAFGEAVLAFLAWGLLARRGDALRGLGFILLELIANLALALEVSRGVRLAGGTGLGASISMTLVWAASGAIQWLRSLSREVEGLRLALAIAGYTWLGIASLKLILVDMAEVDAILRALAFLGVGVIFLAAALTANRLRLARKEEE